MLEEDLEYCNFLLGTRKEKFYQKAGPKFSSFLCVCEKSIGWYREVCTVCSTAVRANN